MQGYGYGRSLCEELRTCVELGLYVCYKRLKGFIYIEAIQGHMLFIQLI